jgi:protein gp37
MSDNSSIEWTDSTWNPVTGCSKVSEGCRNCYAEALSLRFGRSKKPWAAQFAAENVVLHDDRLDYPRKWRDPRRIFVNSMSDLFHENVPDAFVTKVFRVMKEASHHTYQVLTKRPERMQLLLNRWTDRFALRMVEEGDVAGQWPLPNVWIGTSVEDQKSANERIPKVVATPAVVHFLSCEPLLAPVNLCLALGAPAGHQHGLTCREWLAGLQWVIVGGESGPRHRHMDLNWARDIRDQCQMAGVPFFFKQVGGRTPKAGGRLLDGEIWDEAPALEMIRTPVAV